MVQIVQLTNEIGNAISELDSKKTSLSPQEKQKLLETAKELVERPEGPEVGVWRVLYRLQANAALKAAYGMRIFEVFEDQETAQQLSEKTSADKLLIMRIMRALSCVGIFREVGEELYTHNSRSKKFTNPMFRTLMRGMGVFVPYMHKVEDYLASISFKNPDGQGPNLFQFSMQTKMNFFEWLHTQPKELEIFSAAMAASTTRSLDAVVASIAALFPEGMNSISTDVLIVDVGGGRGQILDTLRQIRPDLNGRMIVQDLPKEVEGREECDRIESIAYDFFTPQPIKGAYVYYFRHIFHDWPDSACREILKQTIPAMEQHSRLIISDAALPNTGALLFQSLLDIGMMTLSGMERTERHWRELLEGEGLKVLEIRGGIGSDSIIEASLARR